MTPVSSPPAEPDERHTTEPPPWKQMFIAEDGSVFYDTDARQSASEHIAQNQEEHEARLRRLTPAARRVYATYKRTGVLPLPAPRPPTRARSSRGPTPIRRRGSRRGSTRSPPSSSDDDPHEEPDPLDAASLATIAAAELRAPSAWMREREERYQRARRARPEQLTLEGVAS